jgi:hypothetical protein
MMGHDVRCTICGNYAEIEEDVLDAPPPEDKLCRTCRKAIKDAAEQQRYLHQLQKEGPR